MASSCEPAAGATPKGPVDAVLLIHGSGGSFYRVLPPRPWPKTCATRAMPAWPSTPRATTPCGRPRVRANTYGNALEILDNSRHDLGAGIDYLWEKGYRNIGLLGHSMGAVKVGYYAAVEDDDRSRQPSFPSPRCACPTPTTWNLMMPKSSAGIIEQADRMEAEDRAQELMEVRFPIPQMFSAASYLDKHGPAERYNLVDLAPRVNRAHAGDGRRTGDPHPSPRLPPGHGDGGGQQSPGRVRT